MQGSHEKKLTSIGADGSSHEFVWRRDQHQFEDKWTFRVETDANLQAATGRFFELIVDLKDDDPNTVRVEVMHHHQQEEYRAKGIPEALLPMIKRELNMNVESSPGRGATADIRRNCLATTVWNRLVEKSLANYDKERDVYVLL
jgi:hypothetical protein